jgi:hypothetical protein
MLGRDKIGVLGLDLLVNLEHVGLWWTRLYKMTYVSERWGDLHAHGYRKTEA